MAIGSHVLVWTGRFGESELAAAARSSTEAGFDILELALLDPYGFEVAGARRAFDGLDLQVTASLGLSESADISSDDPECVEAGEALLGKALEVAHDLGSQYLVGVLYSVLKKYPGPASAQGRRNSQEVLRRISERAAELGVTLALEVVNRYETNLFNTARGALAFLDEIDDPRIKVHLDTYHMNIEEPDLFSPVLEVGDRLGYVHIGESHRGYLGSGTVDFDSFFRALAHIGYQGPITFESFSSAIVNDDLSNALAVWRNLWDDSADLGAHACSFIRNQLRANETLALH